MNVLRITKLATAACLFLSAVTVCLLFFMISSLDEERAYVLKQQELRQLGHKLGAASDYLTDKARYYAITGDKQHYDDYWREVDDTRTRDNVVERLKELGAVKEELNLLEQAKFNSDSLIAIEEQSMDDVANGNMEHARELMFDADYFQKKSIIMNPIKEFQSALNARTAEKAQQAISHAQFFVYLTTVTVFLCLSLALGFIYFVFINRISQPLNDITEAMANNDFGAEEMEIPFMDREDEIGELARVAERSQRYLLENVKLTNDLKMHKERLEQTVLSRTKDLTDANNELEEFAYRTSHDLRSPLVSSIGLLDMVEESVNSGEKDIAIESITHIGTSLVKLETLVKDILALTQTKNSEEESQLIDFQNIVESAFAKLAYMDDYTRLQIKQNYEFTDPLYAKRSRVVLIIENLISNAIKYQDKEERQSFLEISTQLDKDQVVFTVRDNGLGIPLEQRSKLFSMFSRFHPRVSFGSGLGLYMMKKSADILDATISFEDTGSGSLFKLELPHSAVTV